MVNTLAIALGVGLSLFGLVVFLILSGIFLICMKRRYDSVNVRARTADATTQCDHDHIASVMAGIKMANKAQPPPQIAIQIGIRDQLGIKQYSIPSKESKRQHNRAVEKKDMVDVMIQCNRADIISHIENEVVQDPPVLTEEQRHQYSSEPYDMLPGETESVNSFIK